MQKKNKTLIKKINKTYDADNLYHKLKKLEKELNIKTLDFNLGNKEIIFKNQTKRLIFLKAQMVWDASFFKLIKDLNVLLPGIMIIKRFDIKRNLEGFFDVYMEAELFYRY